MATACATTGLGIVEGSPGGRGRQWLPVAALLLLAGCEGHGAALKDRVDRVWHEEVAIRLENDTQPVCPGKTEYRRLTEAEATSIQLERIAHARFPDIPDPFARERSAHPVKCGVPPRATAILSYYDQQAAVANDRARRLELVNARFTELIERPEWQWLPTRIQ